MSAPGISDALRILLVTRDEETRRQVTDALAGRARDWRLFWVSQPEHAPTRSEGLQPQIILLDSDLADVDLPLLIQRLAFGSPRAAMLLLVGATLPSLLPDGVHGALTKPVTPDALIPAVGRALVSSGQVDERLAVRQTGALIIVCSVNSGVGCTTTAIRTASALARVTGGPVAVIDADYADAGLDRALGVMSAGSLGDLARRSGRDARELTALFTAYGSGVSVMTAPPSDRKRKPLNRSQVTAAGSALRRVFPWSVVDLGVPHDEMGYALLDLADVVVLTVAPEMTALRETRLFLDQLYARGYPLSKVWVVANRAGMPGAMQTDELQRWLGVRVNHSVPYFGALAGGASKAATESEELSAVYDELAQALVNERGGQPLGTAGVVTAASAAAAGSLKPPARVGVAPAATPQRTPPPAEGVRRSRRFALYGGFVVFLAILAAGAVLLAALRGNSGLLALSNAPGAVALTPAVGPSEPGAAAVPSATVYVEPTQPAPPTVTETATATAAPTATPTNPPTMTPSPEPTATETPTVAPTPTASPTLPPPTATRRVQPTARPTARPAAPAIPAAPIPSSPAPEQSVNGIVTFAWQPSGPLPPGTAYEVVWWNVGEDPAAARGIAAPTTENALAANLDVLYSSGQLTSNRINWAPIIVATSPYRRLTQPGGPGSSALNYAPATGGGGGEGGEPPPPNPKP